MKTDIRARIVSFGQFLPDKILSNKDLESMVETTDEWITSRTGMKERRIASSSETPSFMGAEASKQALRDAQIKVDDVQLVIALTTSPDSIMPSTAALIQDKIGARNAAAFDVNAACSGFLYGLSCAKAFIESGMYQTILLVATEKMSAFVDYEDRSTCVLFGDGAAACVVRNEGNGFVINNVFIGCDGSGAEHLTIPGGGAAFPTSKATLDNRDHFIKMNGREIFKNAVRKMHEIGQKSLEKEGLTLEDVAHVVPHQANSRILNAVAKSFGIDSSKVYQNIHKYGNTSASSVPIALKEIFSQNSFQNGERLLLLAFGAGLTWGASVLTNEVT